MKQNLKLLTGALALMFAASAQAGNYDIDAITAYDDYPPMYVYADALNFVDQLQFTVGYDYLATNHLVTPGMGVYIQISDGGTPVWVHGNDINNLHVELWQAPSSGMVSGNTWTGVTQVANLGTGDLLQFTSGPLAEGNYFFKVSGRAADGILLSDYNVMAYETAPVPEPGELALMLSGLGLMGFMVRRRAERSI